MRTLVGSLDAHSASMRVSVTGKLDTTLLRSVSASGPCSGRSTRRPAAPHKRRNHASKRGECGEFRECLTPRYTRARTRVAEWWNTHHTHHTHPKGTT